MTNTPPPPPPGYQSYGAPNGGVSGPKPSNYLVWSILTTLFCCLPLGVASIVFAAQVDGKYNSGDYAGAAEASARAKKFAIWAAVAGVAVVVLYILAVVVAFGTGI